MQEQAPLQMLTIQEVAQVLKTERDKVEKLINSGRLPALVLPGQEIRIRAEDLLDFIRNETSQFTELNRRNRNLRQEKIEKIEQGFTQLKTVVEKLNQGIQGELDRAGGDYGRILELREVYEEIFKLTRKIIKSQQRLELQRSGAEEDAYLQFLELEWENWQREIEKWQEKFLGRARKAGKKLNFSLARVYQNLVQILINEWEKIRKLDVNNL